MAPSLDFHGAVPRGVPNARYLVHAESEEVARRAVTPQLGELLVEANFKGTLELRPGLLLIGFAPVEPGADALHARLVFGRGVIERLPQVTATYR